MKIVEWFKWRGITLKDFIYGIFSLGLMVIVIGIMIYSLIVSHGGQ